MKRFLSLDTIRGFLIFYVIFIHAILLIIFQANYDYIDILPIWIIALMFPLLLIAMWGPMFSMISAIINTCIIHQYSENKKPIKSIIKKRMLSYILIIIVHLINMLFFIHFIPLDGNIYRSLFCGFLETGKISFPNILMFMNSGTLLLIGLSGLFINIIFLLIWRSTRQKKYIITISFFLGLSIIFFIIRPFIFPWIDAYILKFAANKQYAIAILLSWLFRGQFGFIPMASFPFFGVFLGVLLAKKITKNQFIKITLSTIFCLLILASIFLFIYGIPDLTLPYWPTSMVIFNLAIMFSVLSLVILRLEYAPEHVLEKRKNRSLFFRRFNMITLTIFVFESIITVIWANIFMFFFNDPFPFNVFIDIAFLICVIGTWYSIIRAWERFNFKYSIEWFIIKILYKISGTTSQKLDVRSVLYDPPN